MSSRGQALLELAVCMPVVLLLGFGAAGVVQVADAASGLRAATDAGVAAAVRASSGTQAIAAGHQSFRSVIAAYPIRNAELIFATPSFQRGAIITATADGDVDLAWESMSFLPTSIHLTMSASMEVEPWRSHA